jgi:hypothetical protein
MVGLLGQIVPFRALLRTISEFPLQTKVAMVGVVAVLCWTSLYTSNFTGYAKPNLLNEGAYE